MTVAIDTRKRRGRGREFERSRQRAGVKDEGKLVRNGITWTVAPDGQSKGSITCCE